MGHYKNEITERFSCCLVINYFMLFFSLCPPSSLLSSSTRVATMHQRKRNGILARSLYAHQKAFAVFECLVEEFTDQSPSSLLLELIPSCALLIFAAQCESRATYQAVGCFLKSRSFKKDETKRIKLTFKLADSICLSGKI